ncbi:N-acetylmuramoyl-L-alanine amidase [Actinocatenispora sera]|uniref:N-acetylmuramoyl-L-alanine amidase n=1 Tax=Actinocatenispora sera TaxID=390989 RepID=A0A810L9K2_9ACTN|nr:N-acetylmuramoyl-L-alanine amidase [Actinocatenispora sera]BCJ31917.1 amidase [Actinocatenispora sera]
MSRRPRLRRLLTPAVALALALLGAAPGATAAPAPAGAPAGIAAAARTAQQRYGVPAPLLEAICYLEGRLSDHGGRPSANGGYGCMNLTHNARSRDLDHAAAALGVPARQLHTDQAANIAGAAEVLRADATALSPDHRAPTNLAGWYGAIARYSGADHAVATAYADAVYRIVRHGLTATAPRGETVRIAPHRVTPDTAAADGVGVHPDLPSHCTTTSAGDYPAAYDCIVPTSYDCNTNSSCTYQSANRPTDLPILGVVIHDTEESLTDTMNTFYSTSSGVSIHYVVDGSGNVYQLLREKDIAYQAGNWWYNQRTIGIEHIGYDATGYQWYNATQYLGSAKLSAYLLNRYDIPLDRAHVVAHGTIPAPTLGTAPNHVDPGPYWLWGYYLGLINQQGVAYPTGPAPSGVVRFDPASGQTPLGTNGDETTDNFNFFYLYTQPSTAAPKVPRKGNATDITDETDNIETMLSYDVLAQQPDAAGTGDTMYEVWYGESLSGSGYSATGTKAWIAVPPGAAEQGHGTVVTLASKNGRPVPVFGRPSGSKTYEIGSSPAGSEYLSAWSVTDSGTTYYEINFNHRQAWVPASEVGSTRTS